MEQIQYILPDNMYKRSTRRIFKQPDLDYLVAHHKEMTARQMARQLNFTVTVIYSYLSQYKLRSKKEYRKKVYVKVTLKSKIAEVLEDYVMTCDPIKEVADRNGVSSYSLTKWIRQYYLGRPESEETETLILKSSV